MITGGEGKNENVGIKKGRKREVKKKKKKRSEHSKISIISTKYITFMWLCLSLLVCWRWSQLQCLFRA